MIHNDSHVHNMTFKLSNDSQLNARSVIMLSEYCVISHVRP